MANINLTKNDSSLKVNLVKGASQDAINSLYTQTKVLRDETSELKDIASTKATEASVSATSAYDSSIIASNSEIKANKWADNNYNVEVETGKYSAKHWAIVSQNSVGVKVVESIAELKNLSNADANQIEVLGYYEKGDGGGGLFYWDSESTEEDNSGTIIQATGITTGRWKRVYSGAINVKWFGYTTINLYVSATGNDSNNGFTASTPFLTIQKAIDKFKEFDTTNLNTHTIYIASGTYTDGGVLSGHSFYGELVINGAGKTSTILDGTSASTLMGLNFNNCGNVMVKNLTVQNFSGYGSGIMFQNGTRGVIDTCDCIDNEEANFNCSSESVIYMIGECKSIGSNQGLRIYGLSRGSIGDGTNAITIDAASTGIVVRDGSKAVCQNGLVVQNCTSIGVVALKHGYIELRTCTIQDNVVAIKAENNAILDTQSGTRTLTRNTTDYIFVQNSVDRSYFSSHQVAAQIWKPDGVGSGLNYSSLYDLIVDRNGKSGLQFLTNGNSVNIDFDKTARISVSPTTYIRFVVNNEDVCQMSTTRFTPTIDNMRDLGYSSYRWKTIYAATGTINTSDDREKTYIDITEAEKQVAVELKANMKKFKFNDAIESKGEKARLHFGASAQTVKSIFEKYGLNGFDYAILCYDEWEEQEEVKDEEGNIIEPYRPAGDRYGIRYEELLCFIISAM